MLTLAQLPLSVVIVVSLFILFIVFVTLTMGYLRYYFNKHEPVFTKTATGEFEKNIVAARFCKIVLSNTISNMCLQSVESVGLWMMVGNIVMEWSDDTIMSIPEIHKKLSVSLKDQLDVENYERISTNLIRLELTLDSNLSKSKIASPPYLRSGTYALWVTNVLDALNKS